MSLGDVDCSALPWFRQAILKTGHANLSEALARRLITPRGGLFYDPDYGYDLRQHINQEATPGLLLAIARAVEEECEKDDRVQSADATVTAYDLRTYSLHVACVTVEDTQPYAIAVSVDPTAVRVTEAGALRVDEQQAREVWLDRSAPVVSAHRPLRSTRGGQL